MTALAVTLVARLTQAADVNWLVSHLVVANLHAATHVVLLQLAVAKSLLVVLLQLAVAKSLLVATDVAQLQAVVAKSLLVATDVAQLLAVDAKSLLAVATADAAKLAVVH